MDSNAAVKALECTRKRLECEIEDDTEKLEHYRDSVASTEARIARSHAQIAQIDAALTAILVGVA